MNVNFTIDDLVKGRKPKFLGQSANQTISSANRAFKAEDVPKGTRFIGLSIFTATIYFTFQEKDTPSATNGIQLAVGTHWLPWDEDMLKEIMGFSSTGTFKVYFFSITNNMR